MFSRYINSPSTGVQCIILTTIDELGLQLLSGKTSVAIFLDILPRLPTQSDSERGTAIVHVCIVGVAARMRVVTISF
jgi:hypothetical protein